MTGAETDETAEVYLTGDILDLQVAEGVLSDEGIEPVVRDLHMSAYPFSIGLLGEYRVVVSAWEREAALAVLSQAVADGVLSGKVLE